MDQTFRGLTGTLPSESFFDELYLHFGRREAWRLFDDVLPALEALATRGLKLGIISNWDERLRPLLQELQLSRYFDVIVISCEVGFCKPDRVIFEEAGRKLALPLAAILHIGDNPNTDTVGARAAGMHALELRRGAADHSEGKITSLDEVAEMVRG